MMSAARVYARRRKVWRFGRILIPVWIGLALIATLVMATDVLWPFGWGARWHDVLLGLGMVAVGLLFWGAWNLMFKLLDWLTPIVFGPDPSEQDAPMVDGRQWVESRYQLPGTK
jgi:hypothetical protein